MTLGVLVASCLVIALAMAAVMAGAWSAQQISGNASWIDFGWTVGVGVTGAAAALWPLAGDAAVERRVAVAALIALWCGRLALHLLARARRGTDDPRYAALRRQWGDEAAWQMFRFAQAQALAAVPLVLAVLLAAQRSGAWPAWPDALGILIVVTAVCGEGFADRQLRDFAAAPENKGKVCDRGLWRWSRHPNYFFEWLGWVGFAVIALDFFGNAWSLLALLAPALMYWLLVHVSGLPPLEAHMTRTRGAAFEAYRRRTNAFFPWPPRGAPVMQASESSD